MEPNSSTHHWATAPWLYTFPGLVLLNCADFNKHLWWKKLLKVWTDPPNDRTEQPVLMLWRWVPNKEQLLICRVLYRYPLTKQSRCLRNGTSGAMATGRGNVAGQEGGHSWQVLPGRKAGSGVGVLWGPLAWITQHSEPRRVNNGMSHWKEMSEMLNVWKHQYVPTRIQAGQRGEEQPREARGLASHTVENTLEHLNCLEVPNVLLIACSYQLLFKVFHPHSLSATFCSLIALAQKGRRLLVEKKSRSLSCST